MNLAFGVLSSREPPESVGQLVDALGPRCQVWIHHDDTKGARPVFSRRDVRFVPDPVATRWGAWSLCEAVLRILRRALDDPRWDYFQLLSGSCLPLRPVDAFARHVAHDPFDVHMDAVALERDETALMSHGFRAYAPEGTLRHRALRRLRRWYMGPETGAQQRAGLCFVTPAEDPSRRPLARLAVASMRATSHGALPGFDHPFGPGLACWTGSTWWGARREVCEHFVSSAASDGHLVRYARTMLIPDEFYFQTLACNAGWRVGPSNHWITPFDGPHPVPVAPADVPDLLGSRRWFARKFAPDPADPARRAVLARLYGAPSLERRRLARVA